MIRLSCLYERRNDGSYLLKQTASDHIPDSVPILLTGSQAQLWDILLAIANMGKDSQALLFSQLDRDISARIFSAIAMLVQAECLELDSTIHLNTIEPPTTPRLKKLHLEITHRCNFRCAACYLGERLLPANAFNPAEGTTTQWLRLIKEAARLGCGDAIVSGGDPFARSDLLCILTALSENGIRSQINTNGSFIVPKTARALRSLLISAVIVTVYGFDQASATSYTGNRSAYNAALRGIRCLIEEQMPVVVKYFVTQHNAAGVPFFTEAMRPLGVQVRVMGLGGGIHGDLFTGKPPVEGLAIKRTPHAIVVQENALPCYPSIAGLGIAPDGAVRACAKLAVYFGNAFNDGLERIWEKSVELSAFRDFWAQYCGQMGYVAGLRSGSLCPASDILSKANGLYEFQHLWKRSMEKALT
jgi:MoaA/NifB/PqqE/SkfB family radical SAM enzyme